MTYKYDIQGMTCNGCRRHVEEALASVKGVKHAHVDLDKGEAEIEMSNQIDLEVFQGALEEGGARYSISLPGRKK